MQSESQADAEGTAADAQDQLAAFEARLDERKAALKTREAALKKGLAGLDDRAAKLKEKSADLRERKKEVTEAEALLAETTVPGDGDLRGRSGHRGRSLPERPGKRGCHYTVYGDANGTDALLDKVTPGSASVSLRTGTWFVTRGCAEWTRQ